MRLYLICLISLSLGLISCMEPQTENAQTDTESAQETGTNQPPKNGVLKEKHEKGYSQEITYKNGLREGPATVYYTDGTVYQERMYKNDMLNGEFKDYDWKGRLSRSGTFVNGKMHGEYTRYFRSGNPKMKIQYVHGHPKPNYWHIDAQKRPVSPPEVIITEKNDFDFGGNQVSLTARLSDNSKLDSAIFAPKGFDPIKGGSFDGLGERMKYPGTKASFLFQIQPGYYIMQDMQVFLYTKLKTGENVCFTKTYNLMVERN